MDIPYDGYYQPTALGSIQNVSFENAGIGTTDLIKSPEGAYTEYTDMDAASDHSQADKGWTTSANFQDRHDALYYDQSAIEDMLFKLSMEDTLRIYKDQTTSHEGTRSVW